MALAIALAISAGFAYALASVLQQRAASEEAPELSLKPGLLIALFKRPMWLLGSAVDLGAYGLEAASLAVGSIIVVQPLLGDHVLSYHARPGASRGAIRAVVGTRTTGAPSWS